MVISLSDQMAYVYRGDTLIRGHDHLHRPLEKPTRGRNLHDPEQTPFTVEKYDNAAMPFAHLFDPSGIALHAGYVGNVPNSHGCVHLPAAFAKKLYGERRRTPIYIGA